MLNVHCSGTKQQLDAEVLTADQHLLCCDTAAVVCSCCQAAVLRTLS